MDYMKDSTFAEIVQSCQRQERQGQEQMFNLFYNYAMSVAIRYTPTMEIAEEVVNDSFVKVFTNIDRLYNPELSFKGWLRRIVINTALDLLKKKKMIQVNNLDTGWQVGEESDIVERLTREKVLEYVKKLPTQYKTVFNLYVVDGYTHPEIAVLLNISVGSSKSNLSRARFHLKHLLNENFF
jgi:RNA polymerase sigma-70 factor (ECF subfamily)